MITYFNDYLNEKENKLTFKIIDNFANIFGEKISISDLKNKYTDLIDYIFVLYNGVGYRYYPWNKKFYKGTDEVKLNINDVKYNSVKILPEYITKLEIEYELSHTKDATYSKYIDDYTVDIIGVVSEDDNYVEKVLKRCKIDQKTGRIDCNYE